MRDILRWMMRWLSSPFDGTGQPGHVTLAVTDNAACALTITGDGCTLTITGAE